MSLAARTTVAVGLAVAVGGVVIAATGSLPQRIGVAAAKENLLNPVVLGLDHQPSGLTSPLAQVLVAGAAVALAAVLAWRNFVSGPAQPHPWIPVLVIAAAAAGIELARRFLERSIMDSYLNGSAGSHRANW